jgi:hypothetical protein
MSNRRWVLPRPKPAPGTYKGERQMLMHKIAGDCFVAAYQVLLAHNRTD